MGKGGGGSQQPTDTTVTQTNLPEWAQPYYEDLLDRTAYETATQYQPYGGQRLAYFSPGEQEAISRLNELGTSGTNPNLMLAGQMAGQFSQFNPFATGIDTSLGSSDYVAGAPGSGASYSPTSRTSGYTAGGYGVGYRPGQHQTGYTSSVYTPGYQAGQYGLAYDPGQHAVGYQAGQYDPTYQAGQYDLSGIAALADPDNLRDSEYTATSRQVEFDPGSLADAEELAKYMDPYQQQVVDIQKREAARQADMRHAQTGLGAAEQGSLGGYREGIVRANTERDLMQQMDDIQAQGSHRAFLNAQQAMVSDREGRAQREQLLQSQFGLNREDARAAEQFAQSQWQANQGAQFRAEELRQQGFSMNEALRQTQEEFGITTFGMNQAAQQAEEQFLQSAFVENENARQVYETLRQQGFSMNEAARQVEEQFAQEGFSLTEATRQAEEQFAQSAFGANEAARQAYEGFRQQGYSMSQAAQQAAEQLAQSQFGLNSANQQFAAQQALNMYNSQQAAMQQQAALGLQGQQIQQSGQIAAIQAALAGQQNQLAASQQLGQFAGQQQNMELDRLMAMMNAGMTQRGLLQQGLDMGYGDFLRQQAWPRDQLAFYSAMLQGLPVQPNQVISGYGQMPSYGQQLLGSGLAGLGLYNAFRPGG